MDSGDDVLLADGSGIEELAHEFVIAFGDQFDESFMRGLGLLGHVGGNVFDAGAAVAADLVVVGLHLDEIDDALEVLFGSDGELDGNDVAAKGGGERVHDALEVGALAVHAGADDDAGKVEFVGEVPDLLGDDLDAGDRVHDDESGIDGGDGQFGFMNEHVEAGSIDEVDLGFAPLDGGERGGDGHLPGDFFLVVIGGGGAVIDPAKPGSAAGGEQQGRDKRGFAGVGVANDSHVADILTFVGLHKITPESFDLKACVELHGVPRKRRRQLRERVAEPFAYGARLKRRRASYCHINQAAPTKRHRTGTSSHSATRGRPRGTRTDPKAGAEGQNYMHLAAHTEEQLKQSIVAQGPSTLNFHRTVTFLFIRCDTRAWGKLP